MTPQEWALVLAAVLVTAALVWSLARRRSSPEPSENQLRDMIAALSSEALRTNNEEFLKRANETLVQQTQAANQSLAQQIKAVNDAFIQHNKAAEVALKQQTTQANVDLDKRKVEIQHMLKPLQDTLKRYEESLDKMEKTRAHAYVSLDEQLKALGQAQNALQKETGTLATALRNPQVRGRWGEITLHRVAELAGMSDYCDFTTQESVNSENGRLRPDMVVKLPQGRHVVVDAKAPLDDYLDYVAAATEAERTVRLKAHADKIKVHMRALAAKAYWNQFDRAPEFVVMFLPGEAFFAAALEAEPGLIEEGAKANVILATPTTLISLLKAVVHGWQQVRIAENAEEVRALGIELHERLRTMCEHFGKVGTNLERAVKAYNDTVSSLDRRVLVSARRFPELGAATGKAIETPNVIDTPPSRPQGLLTDPVPETLRASTRAPGVAAYRADVAEWESDEAEDES